MTHELFVTNFMHKNASLQRDFGLSPSPGDLAIFTVTALSSLFSAYIRSVILSEDKQ